MPYMHVLCWAQVDIGDVRLMFPCTDPEAQLPEPPVADGSAATSSLLRARILDSSAQGARATEDVAEAPMPGCMPTMLVLVLAGMHMSSCAQGETGSKAEPQSMGPTSPGATRIFCMPWSIACTCSVNDRDCSWQDTCAWPCRAGTG